MKEVSIICKEGISLLFYQKMQNWLDEKVGRWLIFIEKYGMEIPEEIIKDRRVRIYTLQTPIQKELIAKQIGWFSVGKELFIESNEWKALIEPYHIAAQLILSDAGDFGLKVARHLKMNLQKSARSLKMMKNSMQNVPAFIVGAGPSLEENKDLLKEMGDKGLIIAAGSAIELMATRPHLSVAIDPHIPVKRKQFFDVPICFQSRVHPKSLDKVKGERIYFPDCHFAFEPWLVGEEGLTECGWTSGTAAVSIALHLGCNPIVLIGMDFCYKDDQKYSNKKSYKVQQEKISIFNKEHLEVQTQRDWLLAKSWLENLAVQHSKVSFYNTSSGRFEYNLPILHFDQCKHPFSPVNFAPLQTAIDNAPMVQLDLKRWDEWVQSLHSKEGIALDLLLDPLWNIWGPLFQRELLLDSHPLTDHEKLSIHKELFFQNVTNQFLDV